MPELNLTELEKQFAPAQPGGTNILEIIREVKAGLQLVAQLKGMKITPETTVTQATEQIKTVAPPNSFGQFIQIIKALGLGDMPISQILAQVGPYSVNQLVGQGQKLLSGVKDDGAKPRE